MTQLGRPAPVRQLRTAEAAPVSAIRARAYVVPTDSPEADGTIAWESTTMVVVEVDGGGVTGLGWTYAPAATVGVVRELLAPAVEGLDALDVPAAYLAMADAVRNAGRPGICAMALSAVDTALWDLKARLLGVPLARLLGAVREGVPVYGSGGFTTYDDRRLTTQLEGWLEQGISMAKIKIGEDSGRRADRDLDRARLARGVLGDDAALFVDANGAFTASQALRVFDGLAEAGVTWFEEPVSSDDLIGLRRVRDGVAADVAAGEYGYDLTYFERMCAAGSVDCLQIDVSRCGGITEWQRVAAVAAAHHLEVSGHCAPHLHAHVAAATPNFRHLEWFHDHVRIESMFLEGSLDVSRGVLQPGGGPGHGFSLRPEVMEPYRTV